MVKGHEIKALMAVDLDGTLLRGNSLHIFAVCSLRDALRHGRMAQAATVAGWLALRRLRLCPHTRMKWAIIGATAITPSFKADFAHKIHTSINPRVKVLIDERRNRGWTVLLATAAADLYVPWIWDGPYVATRTAGNPSHSECRGEEKLKTVMAYADNNGLIPTAIVTDHHDDLALLTAPFAERILVSPSARTLRAIKDAGITIDTLIEH